jgi:predicted TIM-barrel enzyme
MHAIWTRPSLPIFEGWSRPDEAVERTQAIVAAARAENPDIVPLCHGGPIATPEDAAHVIEKTDVVGFVGASSMERLATEKAIQSMTEEFKKIRF